MPDLDRYGIHVMASQNGNGEVVLGDSHEYDEDISPFDKAAIDELILEQLRIRIDLPDWTIRERWHGIYAQLPGSIQFVEEVEPAVQVVVASGGCGMTMSFGLAEQLWESWDDSPKSTKRRNGEILPLQPTGNSNGRDAV
jgi:D-hydroxyproline dehydrogenase subunit beta